MLRARLSTGVFVLGLDAVDIRRLMMGQPARVKLAPVGGTDDLCIVYGETIDDIKHDLETASGIPLPPEQTLTTKE